MIVHSLAFPAHPDHDEVVAMAKDFLPAAAPFPAAGLAETPALAPAAAGLGVARELFMNVFVAQALDGATALLEGDKQYIAAKAAAFAVAAVDAAIESVAALKARLGLS